MSYKRRVFNLFLDGLINIFRLDKPSNMKSMIFEKIVPVCEIANGKQYRFYCPNNLTRWRAETLFTKEPETIDWINSFQQGDVMFDIGANVGLYSVYAAKNGIRVVSFEPESQNYAILNHNIFLNHIEDKVMGLNIALSDSDSLDFLFLPKFEAGGALNNLGEATNWKHEQFKPSFRQGIVAFSLDHFIERYSIPIPSHIKIDVDGIEAKIIKGAVNTLQNPNTKSILVELNDSLEVDVQTMNMIKSLGFRVHSKNQSDLIKNSEFNTAFNYIFVK
jgi:FkbM family methyltransferase